jgi:hypothetical protein
MPCRKTIKKAALSFSGREIKEVAGTAYRKV